MIDTTYMAKTFLKRADLYRLNPDGISRRTININLGEIIRDYDSDSNILLAPGDDLVIYSKDLFSKNETVSIYGLINNPGDYELKINMKLKDLIFEAGGVTDYSSKIPIEVARSFQTSKEFDVVSKIIKFNLDSEFLLDTFDKVDEQFKESMRNNNFLKIMIKYLFVIIKDYN